MTQQDLQIIIEIVILIVSLYLAFFKSYFSQKGKNLATKEDIEDITRKVESVKTEFIRETEKLKLDLHFSNQLKFSFKSEEKESIINCHDSYFLWLNYLIDFDLGKFSHRRINEVLDAREKINDLYFNYLNSKAKLELYVKNEEISTQLAFLSKKTQLFSTTVQVVLVEYEELLKEEYLHEKKRYLSGKKTENHASRMVYLEKLHKIKSEYSTSLLPLFKTFQMHCYNYLKSPAD